MIKIKNTFANPSLVFNFWGIKDFFTQKSKIHRVNFHNFQIQIHRLNIKTSNYDQVTNRRQSR